MLAAIFTNDAVTFFWNGRHYNVPSSDVRFSDVRKAIKGRNEGELKKALNKKVSIPGYRVEVKGNNVLVNGKALHNAFTDMVVRLMREGFDTKPFANFLRKLYTNPRNSVV